MRRGVPTRIPLALLFVALTAAFGTVLLPARAGACVAVSGQGRAEFGQGNVAGLVLGLGGVGGELCIGTTFRLSGGLLVLAPIGVSIDGRTAHGGAGGELAFVLMPFPTWPVRPFLRTSAGVLLFPAGPFLPGGDIYEFILGYGLGIEVPIGKGPFVSGDVHYTHLSNGQGLGAFNPAFDGIGAGLTLGYRFDADIPGLGPWNDSPVAEEQRHWIPGVVVETDGGFADGNWLAQGRASLVEQLTPTFLGLLDATGGGLAGYPFGEVELGAVGHWPSFAAGVELGGRDYTGLLTAIAVAQVEAHATAEVSFVAMGRWEHSILAGNVLLGSIGMRAFPIRSLVVDIGVGFDSERGPRLAAISDPYFGIEWRLPFAMGGVQASLFAEDQVTSMKLAGIRFASGMGETLREQARATGWRLIR